MDKILLTEMEIAAIQALVSDIAARYSMVDDEAFLKEASILAFRLPERLCRFLVAFKLTEPFPGVCLVSGYPVDQERVGKTPPHWFHLDKSVEELKIEFFVALCGSLLGDLFGWMTQQQGFLVHNIVPTRGDEHTQLSSASEESLVWHTEDAFHPYRGDYLGMFCIRNPYQAATTYASVDMIELENAWREKLFEPHYTIRPDLAHLEHLKKNEDELEKLPANIRQQIQRSFAQVNEMSEHPSKRPVLFGNPDFPYICDDPFYMDDELVEDCAALEALHKFNRSIDGQLYDLILQPGDLTFLDNFKVVHGRRGFKATFDGNDRWLKRINVTRDLRKSRGARPSVTSRVIY